MKVIFLDIDGVLNDWHTKEKFEEFTFVDDGKVLLLKELIKRTGAKVVLTSTWRRGWFCEEHPYIVRDNEDEKDVRLFRALRAELKEFDIELFSFTADLGNRGDEIDWWLKSYDEEPVEAFVILDDMGGAFLRPHSAHLVQTSMAKGLQANHIKLAEKILMKV